MKVSVQGEVVGLFNQAIANATVHGLVSAIIIIIMLKTTQHLQLVAGK